MTGGSFAFEVAQWEADHLALNMECAYIEAFWGKGSDEAMQWISETLEDGNNVPDGEHSENAVEWWDAHYRPAPTPPEPPVVTCEHAVAVLGWAGHKDGVQPDGFVTALLVCFDRADPDNFNLLASVFPGYGQAMRAWKHDPHGVAKLADIARQVTP